MLYRATVISDLLQQWFEGGYLFCENSFTARLGEVAKTKGVITGSSKGALFYNIVIDLIQYFLMFLLALF